MNQTTSLQASPAPSQAPRKLSRDTVSVIGELLPVYDFAAVLLAAWFTSLLCQWLLLPPAYGFFEGNARAALGPAVIAPFILYEHRFVTLASGAHSAMLARRYAARFLLFVAAVSAIGTVGSVLDDQPARWIALWMIVSLLCTAGVRLLLVGTLRRLERRGLVSETIAIVGGGPAADRLVQQLRQTRGHRIEIVGIFDDRGPRGAADLYPATRSTSDLIELGKTRSMDWLLITLPDSAESRLQSLVHRLKVLATPIGLCPPDSEWSPPSQRIQSLGDGMAVSLLAPPVDRPGEGRSTLAEAVLPRWVFTWSSLPLPLLSRWFRQITLPSKTPLQCVVDDYDLEGFTQVASRFGQQHYGYVVTPNADHLARLHREPAFVKLYSSAAFVLLDSRFIAKLLRLTKKRSLPVCTGSDLTTTLFKQVIQPQDRIVLIGGTAEQAVHLRERFQLEQLAHFNPPMGFIRDAAAVEACLSFVEQHNPFRFCFLAVGCPQQEVLAQRLGERGVARGMALCVGASINFLTGDEQRAPVWMQNAGFEWLFRLLQSPGRMAGRYLKHGPQLFWLLYRTEIVLRVRVAPVPPTEPETGLAVTS